MMIEGDARRLTIYVGSRDTWHGKNLAAAIVERCRSMGMAGTTLTRGIMGFGKNSRIHRRTCSGSRTTCPSASRWSTAPSGSTRCCRYSTRWSAAG